MSTESRKRKLQERINSAMSNFKRELRQQMDEHISFIEWMNANEYHNA